MAQPIQNTQGITADTHPDLIARREIDEGLHDNPAALEAMKAARSSPMPARDALLAATSFAEPAEPVAPCAPQASRMAAAYPLPVAPHRGRPRKLEHVPFLAKILRVAAWGLVGQKRHLKDKARPAAVARHRAKGAETARLVQDAERAIGPGATAAEIADHLNDALDDDAPDVSTIARARKRIPGLDR